MPVTFKHRQSGRTVTLPEPDDHPVRRVRARQMAIRRVDKEPDWERVDGTEPDDTEQPDPKPEPHPSDVRAWAKDNGYDVKSSGKIPSDIVEAYKQAAADDPTDRWDEPDDEDEPDGEGG